MNGTRTKKTTAVQQKVLDLMAVREITEWEFPDLDAGGSVMNWLLNKGLGQYRLIPFAEGCPPQRVWTITDAGRAAQKAGRFIIKIGMDSSNRAAHDENRTEQKMATKERALTSNQLSFLKSAAQFGGYAEKGPGAGWIWDTASNTKRICESMTARGYFTKEQTPFVGVVRYVLTDKAHAALAAAAEQRAMALSSAAKDTTTTTGPSL
jgi:DNA-binding MarR family transcriptional regulator